MNKKVVRVTTVLQRMIDMCVDDEYYADIFEDALEDMLEEIACDDGFGTERQSDPRGDGRNRECWSMKDVEGVEDDE